MTSFFKHSFNYVVSNGFNQVLTILLVFIILVWLNPSQYGLVMLLLSYFQIFNIITSLNLYRAIPIYLGKGKPKEKIGSIFILMGFVTIIAIFLLLMYGLIYRGDIQHLYIYSLLMLASGFFSFWSLYKEILIFEQMSLKYSIIYNLSNLILFGSSILLTYTIFLIDFDDNFGRIYGTLIQCFFLFLIVLFNIKQFNFKFDKTIIKYFLGISLPLILFASSSVILTYVDRIMIERITGDLSAVGIYSFSYNLGMLINIVSMSIINNYRVEYFKNIKDNPQKINKIITFIVPIVFLLYVLMSVIIPWLLPKGIVLFSISSEYELASSIVPLILTGYYFFFLQAIFVMDYYYRESTLALSLLTAIVAITNIILNYYLIPIFSYTGAAASTTISYFLLMILIVFFNKSKNIINTKNIIIIIATTIIGSLIAVFYLTN
ncbi:polysaccharide biosynthesis protein [Sinobaca qinghaiensis]|uniref:Polysaccharide biosynthesis protein n=1 Tax=Sinobaca qinghaiensis TaxID=342944 RepID=A0A419V8L6_9BACL|nr:oligosaccharide flippase family protein [Sinobaca qinghaiensis]RKD76308.1 polysaccharide biosynthesis protein [Sinobaca qinghaiensis]